MSHVPTPDTIDDVENYKEIKKETELKNQEEHNKKLLDLEKTEKEENIVT